MNKIQTQLQKIREEKRLGLMTHIVIGYPTLQESEDLIVGMAKNGVDFIELQIPFSDPLADGPVIYAANTASLQSGTKVKNCFKFAKTVSSKVGIPLLFMCYFNTIYNYGIEEFCRDTAATGLVGMIVPDYNIDQEKQDRLLEYCKKYKLSFIPLATPASEDKRLKKISRIADTFVYCVARLGITGKKTSFDSKSQAYLKKIDSNISVGKALGFGIREKTQLKLLKGKIDIAIIGSAVIERLRDKGVPGALKFIKELAS